MYFTIFNVIFMKIFNVIFTGIMVTRDHSINPLCCPNFQNSSHILETSSYQWHLPFLDVLKATDLNCYGRESFLI